MKGKKTKTPKMYRAASLYSCGPQKPRTIQGKKDNEPSMQKMNKRRYEELMPSSDQSPFWERSRTWRPLSVSSGWPSLPTAWEK